MIHAICRLKDIQHLFEQWHGYGSVGAAATYAFGVFESGQPVAAFVWSPPPFGAARAVGGSAPGGVLALSRMVAVPKETRELKHISKPLKQQMRNLIDRGRWPVLVTYSDEGQGHTGHVYKCSGWTKTSRVEREFYEDAEGRRRSTYCNGQYGGRELVKKGTTWLQRWEHRVCEAGDELRWMQAHGWARIPTKGKWKSGNVAHKWVKEM